MSLKDDFQKRYPPHEDKKWPALLGNASGVINAGNGQVYVTTLDNQVLKLRNKHVPKVVQPVWIGYKEEEPDILQVLTEWDVYAKPNLNYLIDHHTNHEYPAFDTVWVNIAQFKWLLCLPNGAFAVKIFGGPVRRNSTLIVVPNQTINIVSSVPATGALYVLLESNSSGVVTAVDGTPVAGVELLTASDIPAGTVGSFPLCAIQVYGSQDKLRRTDTVNDFVDLRFGDVGDYLTANAPIAGATKTKITYDTNGLVTAGADADMTDIPLPKTGTPNLDTLAEDFTTRGSSGVSDSTINYIQVDTGAHKVKVAAGEGYLRTTNSQQGVLNAIEWSAATQIDIPVPAAGQETVRFIGIEYNAGTPQVTTRTTFNWNWYDDFPLGRVTYDGTTLWIVNLYAQAEDTANRARKVLSSVFPFQREAPTEGTGGLELSEVATRQLAMSGGNIWHGFNQILVSAFTAGSAFAEISRRAGGGFNTSSATQYDNFQYDDGSGALVTMMNNRYKCCWIYVNIANSKVEHIIGRGQYTSVVLAQAEGLPTVPSHLFYHGRLIARIIIRESTSSAAIPIESAWSSNFTGAANPVWGDIGGTLANQTDLQSALDGKAATSRKLDDFGTPDDNTDLNANTTNHGLVVKATAPSSGIRNVVAIDNAETVYKNTALFDTTNPADVGTAAPGTSLIAARRDHVHGVGTAEVADCMDFVMTLVSGDPYPTADQTAKTTIYITPVDGDRISLYDGAASWNIRTSTEFSLALGTLTSGKPYDVFVYDNAGVPTAESLAWSSDTARATALTRQNGRLVKSGALTRRYIGTFYTTATTTTEDSQVKRYLWNYYNSKPKSLYRLETTVSWSCAADTTQQVNANTANQVAMIIGIAGMNEVSLNHFGDAAPANSSTTSFIYIYKNGVQLSFLTVKGDLPSAAFYAWPTPANDTPALGLNKYQMYERSSPPGATTFYGNANYGGYMLGTLH